jgi:hypothetical protein
VGKGSHPGRRSSPVTIRVLYRPPQLSCEPWAPSKAHPVIHFSWDCSVLPKRLKVPSRRSHCKHFFEKDAAGFLSQERDESAVGIALLQFLAKDLPLTRSVGGSSRWRLSDGVYWPNCRRYKARSAPAIAKPNLRRSVFGQHVCRGFGQTPSFMPKPSTHRTCAACAAYIQCLNTKKACKRCESNLLESFKRNLGPRIGIIQVRSPRASCRSPPVNVQG